MGKGITKTIDISAKAREELVRLDISHQDFLRLWVVAGGCKGLTYQAAIDDVLSPEDQVLYQDSDIKVVADPQTAAQVGGLRIDYSDDLMAGGFRFSNPNATATCGCGASFCGSAH
ncbi:MAG: iron-sulfur cluster assembly accessory protein [Acidobacteriota bacterium]